MARIDAMDLGEVPTREEVRQILSKIPGSLTDDIRAERDRLDLSAWLDHELMAEIDAADEVAPTHEELMAMMADVPGTFADDIRAERDL